jgi:hypothetical protein
MKANSALLCISRYFLTVNLFLLAAAARAAVTDAQIANLTSRSFDFFLRSDGQAVTPVLEIFLTANGSTTADAVIAEFQPLFTGATAGDDYARRQANRTARAALTTNGSTLFRASNCEADTTYYVRARFGGVTVWPTNNTLLAVHTLPAAEWNGGARQCLVGLGRDGTGYVGTLTAAGAAAPLLSVAGDRAATNSTLFFNLTDCMGTNGLPLALAEGAPLTLTLYSKLGSESTSTILAAAPPAPDTLVASADAFQKNLLSLMVASAAGVCSPNPGEHLLFDGSMVTCRLEQTLITQVSTQFVGYGWIGSGNVPVNGRTASCTFAMSSDSSLRWLWRTNYWLEVIADHGTIDLSSGWYRSGSRLGASVTPNAEWLFSQWSGLATGTTPAVSLVLGAPGQLRASFAPVLVPGGGGMPEWWLTQAGLAGANRNSNADPDHDGMNNQQEWMADTSPTNKTSDLRITALAKNGGLLHLTWRGGRESRQIVEVLDGSLVGGEWHPIATNLPPTETVGTCAVQIENRPTLFFRIKAER